MHATLSAAVAAAMFLLLDVAAAQTPGSGCTTFTVAEVTAVVGATVTPAPNGRGCAWRASGDRALVLRVIGGPGMAVVAETTFKSARTALVSAASVKTETGIGDAAYSHPSAGGAVFAAMKNGQFIQLVLTTDAPGTASDVDRLRTLARKAVDAVK